MTSQEIIDRDLRMLLGDLQVQLIFARARIAELEEATSQMAQQLAEKALVEVKPNGAAPVEVEKKAEKEKRPTTTQ